MRDLAGFASQLADRFGGLQAAVDKAFDLAREGGVALGPRHDDISRLLRDTAVDLGVILRDGTPNAVRCAELAVVCDILSRAPAGEPAVQQSPRLVFTTPAEAASRLEPSARLDLLVADIIRMSTRTVDIGGPFWNDEGFEHLLEVLTPAVESRGVECTFYVHTPEEPKYLETLTDWIAALTDRGSVTVRWYDGPERSLMHAKFIVADAKRGYLGSANFTGLGFQQHVEMGVELTAEQSKQLLAFLGALEDAGLFTQAPPTRTT